MSNVYANPAFTTRRPTYDGDYVRGESGGDLASYIRYAIKVPENLDESLFVSRAVDYDTIQVWWGPPAGIETQWEKLAVVRSGFGYPVTPADGEILVWLDSHVANDEVSSSVLDAGLPAGRWYYYSLMYQYNGIWYRSNTTADMVPIDYAHRDAMYDLVPPYHQFVDAESSISGNTMLQRWFDVIGYDLDYTRTLAEQIEVLYDVDQAPTQLLSQVGKYNLGFAVEEDGVGTIRYRSLLGANRQLVDKRGTAEGLAEYVQALTKYRSSAQPGLNQLLLADDAEFQVGVGNWSPMPYGMSRYLFDNSNYDPSQDDFGQTIPAARHGFPTQGLSLERFEDTDVIAYPTDPYTGETLPARGMLKVTADASTPMVITCGAGQQDSVVGNIPEEARPLIDHVHLDPKHRGVPISPDEIYYFSFWEQQLTAANTDTIFGILFFEREPLPVGPTDTTGASSAGTFTADNLDNSDDFVGRGVTFADGQHAVIHTHTAGSYDIYPDTYNAEASGEQEFTITTRETCGFSDGFWGHDESRAGFNTYGEVVPIDNPESWKILATEDASTVWERRIISVQSPANARFAVPFIWIAGVNGAALANTRYFTGMMFSKSQGLGVETVYQPNDYLVLLDEATPETGSDAIGEEDGKVLGEP